MKNMINKGLFSLFLQKICRCFNELKQKVDFFKDSLRVSMHGRVYANSVESRILRLSQGEIMNPSLC